MSVDVTITADDCCSAHDHQFTYNYTPALREAGFPGWKMLDGFVAHIVAVFTRKVIVELTNDRDRYHALIRGGGEWGTISTLLESLSNLLVDLEKHPRGVVRCT